MTAAAKKLRKPRPTTPVVKGWVVKKLYTKLEKVEENGVRHTVPKRFEKTISKSFKSREAAVSFCALAQKYPPPPVQGETDVEFFVAEDGGFDDLKAEAT